MKKLLSTLLLTLLISLDFISGALAQNLSRPLTEEEITFDLALTDSMRSAGSDFSSISTNISNKSGKGLRSNFILSQMQAMKTPIMLGVKLKTATNENLLRVKSFSKTYSTYRISDNSDAVVIALGINKNNVDDYRYRVVLNDSAEVIHWSKIPRLEQKYGALKPYGFIGSFNYPGKQVLVEVVNMKNYQFRDGIIFDWRKNFTPVIIDFVFHSNISYNESEKLGRQIQAPHVIKYDPVTGVPTDIRFVADSVQVLNIYFKDHESVPYIVKLYKTKNGKRESYGGTSSDPLGTKFNLIFVAYPPGDYEIVVSALSSSGSALPGKELHIPLKILPNSKSVLEKKASLKVLLPFLIVALLIFSLLFWIYKRRANMKLARSIQAKQTVNFKLKAIRSQLNPHFMFNALTSIQNLVNKKDMEGANHYLSRFANLTRKVLNTGEHDLISLEDEIKILDDYMQMEQLRFNFKYDIRVDAGLNRANTDVPAMLLQPFVENAVKHGVANLRENGVVNVLIKKENTNLVFAITDNGSGFKKDALSNESFGLKLSEERIQLLNEIYKDQPTVLNVQSDSTGTTVTLTLTNWIS